MIHPNDICLDNAIQTTQGRFPVGKISMGSDRIGTKLNPRTWAFGTNFVFQLEPLIRNPDDKELKYFQPFPVRRCG